MPAAAVASRTPSTGGISGKDASASGEMLVDIVRHPEVRGKRASKRDGFDHRHPSRRAFSAHLRMTAIAMWRLADDLFATVARLSEASGPFPGRAHHDMVRCGPGIGPRS